MDRVDCVVVGAGVVGLAIARALSLTGREVVIVEAEGSIGTGTSSRNSEVVHAGIYYPVGSSKARLCVSGRERLYAYCAERGVPHRKLGKLIVATDKTQIGALETIRNLGAVNGVDDLRFVATKELQMMEPDLACQMALISPSTGIVDSHSLMQSLLADAETMGAMIAYKSPVLRVMPEDSGFVIELGGTEIFKLRCKILINASGLNAWAVARSIHGISQRSFPNQYFAKGNYFNLTGIRAPFSRLIYPVPEEGGLGVHLTLDLAGHARFGPDVEWLHPIGVGGSIQGSSHSAKHDYTVDPQRANNFYACIQRYWPALPMGSLVPAYSGIRPKVAGPGQVASDFTIQGLSDHQIPGLINLFGIESPGLTASLTLADEVLNMIDHD